MKSHNCYITNGTTVIECKDLADACIQAAMKDWEEEQEGAWKVRRV